MNDEAVYRTAPATPGLLNTQDGIVAASEPIPLEWGRFDEGWGKSIVWQMSVTL